MLSEVYQERIFWPQNNNALNKIWQKEVHSFCKIWKAELLLAVEKWSLGTSQVWKKIWESLNKDDLRTCFTYVKVLFFFILNKSYLQ